MLSVSELFEQEKKPAAQSSAVQRREWAKQRVAELKSAFGIGRVDSRTYHQKLRYWQKAASGSAASPAEAQTGNAATAAELKTMGTFF